MNSFITKETFVEVGYYQKQKYGEGALGDTFLSEKNKNSGRVISVLSDGLGSGIKAGVLSTLTATMAMKFISLDIPFKRAANTIMNTLPVCKERGISYATFTLVDIESNSNVKVMEYDNPSYLLIRDGTVIEPIKLYSKIERKNLKTAPSKEAVIYYSDFKSKIGDRLIFFSDGVTQSGMGSKAFPLGWGESGVQKYILSIIEENPTISARNLAKLIVQKALSHDIYKAKDDISSGVIYFRNPRDLLIMTGPPINIEHDQIMVANFSSFLGKKIISGGTTAKIISEKLGKSIKLNLKNIDPEVPPISEMEGADLVTEGIITLGRVAEILEESMFSAKHPDLQALKVNGATKIIDLLNDSDRILFMVGTKINEAHQDPNMPVELEIRRNVVKKIVKLLNEHYMKDVYIQYI